MKAHLTRPVTQKEIINEAIEKGFYLLLDQRSMDNDTIVLFVLHSVFGFGAERTRRFYESYVESFKAFYGDYEEATYDRMREDLKKYGIEVEKWNKELMG